MEYNELIKYRYSCRDFSNKIVEQKIIEAGILAPTARNIQPEIILVLTRKEDLAKLHECTKHGWNAPVCLIICYDKKISYKRQVDSKEFGDIDVSIIATHMMLEIYNLCLVTTWIENFDPQKVKELYNLPENYEPVVLLPIGYASNNSKPSDVHYQRKDIKEIII